MCNNSLDAARPRLEAWRICGNVLKIHIPQSQSAVSRACYQDGVIVECDGRDARVMGSKNEWRWNRVRRWRDTLVTTQSVSPENYRAC